MRENKSVVAIDIIGQIGITKLIIRILKFSETTANAPHPGGVYFRTWERYTAVVDKTAWINTDDDSTQEYLSLLGSDCEDHQGEMRTFYSYVFRTEESHFKLGDFPSLIYQKVNMVPTGEEIPRTVPTNEFFLKPHEGAKRWESSPKFNQSPYDHRFYLFESYIKKRTLKLLCRCREESGTQQWHWEPYEDQETEKEPEEKFFAGQYVKYREVR